MPDIDIAPPTTDPMELARQRARRGAALLDIERPGWRARVVAEQLDMAYPWGCVLGQLDGLFSTGLRALRQEPCTADCHDFAEAHGFDVIRRDGVTYRHLDAAWREILTAAP